MHKKYFGTDGIRGMVGKHPITPDFMLKLGWAVGRVFVGEEYGFVLVGKDTRISGYMFESAIEAGLSAAGANTRLLGPMPTPGIAYLTRTLRAKIGIAISASHNPYHDNGIKFFSEYGTKLSDKLENKIEEYMGFPMTTVESSKLGKASRLTDAAGRYIEFCKSTIPTNINFKGMRIIVDCAHGATYHIAPHVFNEVGGEVVSVAAEPNGLNINNECGATRPEYIASKVLEYRANLGIALDGDGDRLIMADHKGEIVDGDELVYIIAKSNQNAGISQKNVVGTLMSNIGMEYALNKIGINLLRANVGDRYVIDMLIKHKAILGGEGSGHIICLNKTTTGDGIVAALQVITEMQRSGKSLHELKQGMQKYPNILKNIRINKKINIDEITGIKQAVQTVEKKIGKNGRVLLRASGTEPLIRVMVEGEDKNDIDAHANQLVNDIKKAI